MTTDQHMLVAVTRHADGSLSSRVWPLPANTVDATVASLGDPYATAHTPAGARAKAADAVAEVNRGSVIVTAEEQP